MNDTTVQELINHLETIAPSHLQASYDNAGLLTGNPDWPIRGVLVALDGVESIVDEAIQQQCNVIVAHHPIIFKGLKKLTGETYIERTIIKAIKHDIAIYAIHTNLDHVHEQGVNSQIAQKLALTHTRVLAPSRQNTPERPIGAGLIGELVQPMATMDFLELVKSQMKTNCLKFTRLIKPAVHLIAVCGGAGSFLVPEAIRQQADVYISADFKYHEFFDANEQIIIADIGHYESEQFTIPLLVKIISEKFSNFAVRQTTTNTNPVQYLI